MFSSQGLGAVGEPLCSDILRLMRLGCLGNERDGGWWLLTRQKGSDGSVGSLNVLIQHKTLGTSDLTPPHYILREETLESELVAPIAQ